MNYELRFHPQTKGDFANLDSPIKKRIKERLPNRLVRRPEYFGEPLRGSLKDLWKFRMGDYRVVFSINPKEKLLFIYVVAHRKEAHQKVKRRFD